jgi:beta-1,4-N-acetylglucosaminyltransferase
MLAIVSALDAAWYSPRTYVVAATDALGPTKAAQAEAALAAAAAAAAAAGVRGRGRGAGTQDRPPGHAPLASTVLTIPRSREVGQSYLTSVWTTLVALAAAFQMVWGARPDLLLVNGPGTCLPIVAAAVVCRCVCLV